MNEKEVSEIRRQINPDKTNITAICGCYVNDKKEILSTFRHSVALMSMDETEEILAIIKKTLSGTIGKNLIDIPFPTSAVANSEEHKMLMKLRETRLEDEECVKAFFENFLKSLFSVKRNDIRISMTFFVKGCRNPFIFLFLSLIRNII